MAQVGCFCRLTWARTRRGATVVSNERVLNVDEAAQIIYHTRAPSAEQIDKIRYKLARGVLKSSSKGRWTTTTGAVADYLSRRTFKQGYSHHKVQQRQLFSVYRELVRDYCRAVLLRRAGAKRSRLFETAVIVGQAACLVFLAGALLLGHRSLFASVPPEQTTVEQWLEDHEPSFQIVEWFAPAEDGRLRVKYKYDGGKTILTDRTFVVRGGQVVEVEQTD